MPKKIRDLHLKKRGLGRPHKAVVKFAPATDEELKKALGETIPDGYVAGWASTSGIDLYGHKVMPGAFAQAIVERGLEGPTGIKALFNHDSGKPVGKICVLEYRGDRLWIEMQLNLKISYARDVYEISKDTGGLNFSVGFMLQDYEFKEDEEEGFEFLQINRGDLYEVSVVVFPGNEEATMDFVKGMPDYVGSDEDEEGDEPSTLAEFQKALVAEGLCTSRNHARKITLAVKENAHLFKQVVEEKEAPDVTDPSKEERPQLDVTKLNDIAGKLASIKSILAK